MKTIEQRIAEAVNSQATASDAARSLIESAIDFKPGQSVAVIDDPTMAYPGVRGVFKGQSAKGSGFCDVQLPNGDVVPMQSDLLIPLA